MKMRKVENGEVLKMGDVMKLKSNQKTVPICLLVGLKVCDVRGYCGDDLEGFYRELVDPEFKTDTVVEVPNEGNN